MQADPRKFRVKTANFPGRTHGISPGLPRRPPVRTRTGALFAAGQTLLRPRLRRASRHVHRCFHLFAYPAYPAYPAYSRALVRGRFLAAGQIKTSRWSAHRCSIDLLSLQAQLRSTIACIGEGCHFWLPSPNPIPASRSVVDWHAADFVVETACACRLRRLRSRATIVALVAVACALRATCDWPGVAPRHPRTKMFSAALVTP